MSRIDEVLATARARIVRYTPADAWAANDVLIVDLRPDEVRLRTGTIPGSVHVPRSVLEWRADPTSEWHDPTLAGKRLVLVCAEGYSSSLAAASLVDLGVDAGDLDGGFDGWVEAGLPVQ
jgi:rhodanese-related sulfurtransferase